MQLWQHRIQQLPSFTLFWAEEKLLLCRIYFNCVFLKVTPMEVPEEEYPIEWKACLGKTLYFKPSDCKYLVKNRSGIFRAFLSFKAGNWCEGSRASSESLLTYVILQGGVSGQVPEQGDRCLLHCGVADVQHGADAREPAGPLNHSPGHRQWHLWRGNSVSLRPVQSLRKSHTQPALCTSLSIFQIVLSQSYIWVEKGGDKKKLQALFLPGALLVVPWTNIISFFNT